MDYSGKFSKLSEQTVGYRNEQDFLYKVSLIAMNYETPPQTTQYGKIQLRWSGLSRQQLGIN